MIMRSSDLIVVFVFFAYSAKGESTEELAQKLNNAVAALISVPFQNNFDFGGGYNDKAFRYQLNFQPVIPISLGEDWNLISRTILPFIQQHGYIPAVQKNGSFRSTSQTGLGDLLMQGTLARWDHRRRGTRNSLSNRYARRVGVRKWGIGPTVVLLRQSHGWTYGILAYHIWSYAGDSERDDVSYTFLQPFLTYTTKTSTTFGVNTESTYDWENQQWNVPLNFFISQVVKIGDLPMSFQFGGRYYCA